MGYAPIYTEYVEELNMPRSQRNDNFIDKTFTVLADILLQVLPTTKLKLLQPIMLL